MGFQRPTHRAVFSKQANRSLTGGLEFTKEEGLNVGLKEGLD